MKLELKFSIAQNGWREIYWIDRSSATPENYRSTARAFAASRVALLCSSAILQEFSLSNPAVPRHSVVDTSPNAIPPGLPDDFQDVADTAVMVKFESADRRSRRTLWLRGLPDDLIAFNGNRSQFTPQARDLLNTYLAGCLSLGMVIRGENRIGVPGIEKPILDVRPATGGTRVAIKSPTHLLTGGETVSIRGCKFGNLNAPRRAINGRHLVIPSVGALAPNDWFEINVAPGALAVGDYLGGGGWTKRFIQTVPVVFASAPRFATRSTGRSPVLTRGRRSAKRRTLPLF